MKRALTLPQYSQVRAPVAPPGVVQVAIDSDTGELATPHCPRTETDYFVEGTQPGEYCHLHFLQPVQRASSLPAIAGVAPPPDAAPAVAPPDTPAVVPVAAAPPPPAAAPTAPSEVPQPKKRGFFGRVLGIFKGDSDSPEAGKR